MLHLDGRRPIVDLADIYNIHLWISVDCSSSILCIMRLMRQVGSILVKAHAEHAENRFSNALSQASRCTYDSARELSQKSNMHGTGAALAVTASGAGTSGAQANSGPPVSVHLFNPHGFCGHSRHIIELLYPLNSQACCMPTSMTRSMHRSTSPKVCYSSPIRRTWR